MALYTILDISVNASTFELEQAYRTRSLHFVHTLDSRDHREFYAVSDAFQILRKHRKEYNQNMDNFRWLSEAIQHTTPAVEFFCKCFGMPQMEPFIGCVPVLHWMLNLVLEFPFKERLVRRIPQHILRMIWLAREKQPLHSFRAPQSLKPDATHHGVSRGHVDPYLRHVSTQSYILDRGQEIDVTAQVNSLRILLDVDLEGDTNLWEQKWSPFFEVHKRNEIDSDDEYEAEGASGAHGGVQSMPTFSQPETHRASRGLGSKIKSILKDHKHNRERSRSRSRDPSTSQKKLTLNSLASSTSNLLKHRDSNTSDTSIPDADLKANLDPDVEPGFSPVFMARFQNELELLLGFPFAPSVFQAAGTMFKLRAKGLARQYLPTMPLRGSHFEQAKQSARAILLMDRCVDAKERCLKINQFWGKHNISFIDQINFIYTTCFYELIREVAINVNRIVSQLFEEDEGKVRRRYKRQRAHRLWEMGDWMVKKGAEMAAKRGLHIKHNSHIKPDDVVSSVVALTSYMEFVVINHRPYQSQSRINYAFVKTNLDCEHVAGDKSESSKACLSLWTPWAIASCNPLTISDPAQANEFSNFDFRYQDVFKKKKDTCECGVSLVQ